VSFVDQNNALIVGTPRLGMTYDIFTRTTTANHYRVTQELFLNLFEKGYLVKTTQMGAFDPVSGRTLPDRYIEGKCPICGFPDARGDQCDNCGNQLDPIDLIDPHQTGQRCGCRVSRHGALLLRPAAFGERLKEWIEQHDNWRPNVRKYSLEFVTESQTTRESPATSTGVGGASPGLGGQPTQEDLRLVRRGYRFTSRRPSSGRCSAVS